jgi:heme exporter protein C
MRRALTVVTFIALAAATWMALVYAPTEPLMGHVQRLFYFHMGTVWVATVAFIIVFVASIMYLWKQTRGWDILAYCSAEIGVLFLTITILTGSVWAKTTFILWILYIVYLILRSSAGTNTRRAKFAAVFGIIAFIDLPLVYLSVRVMRGISPVVFGPGGGGIEPEMMHALLVNLAACSLLFIVLLLERMDLERMGDMLARLRARES